MAKTNINDNDIDPEAEARRQALQSRLAGQNSLDPGAISSGDYLRDPGLPQTYGAQANAPAAPTFDLDAIRRQGATLAAQADAQNPLTAGRSIFTAPSIPGAGNDAGSIVTGARDLGKSLGLGLSPQETRERGAGDILGSALAVAPVGEVGGAAGKLLTKIPGVEGLIGGARDLVGGLASRLGGGTSAVDNALAWGNRGAEEIAAGAGPADAAAAGKGFRLVGDAVDNGAEAGWQQAAKARGAFAGAAEAAGNVGARTGAELAEQGLGGALKRSLSRIPKPVVAGSGVIAGAGALGALSGGEVAPEASTPLPNQQNPNTPITDAALAQQAADRAKLSGGTTTPPPPPPPGSTTVAPRPPITTTTTTTQPTTQPKTPIVPPKPPVLPPVPPKPPVGGTGGGVVTGAGPAGGATGGLPDQGGNAPVSSSGLAQQINSDLGDIAKMLAAGAHAPDVSAIFAAQGKTVLDMLDQQIASLQAEGSSIDPATQNTLQTMRDELDRQLKTALEDLNRRGIAESGIRSEVETLLRKGNMSDQAKILAERLTRIQTNIQSLRGQKTATAGQFALAGAQGQTQADLAERNHMDQLRGQLMSGRSALLQNQTGIEQAQASRDFQAEQNNLQRQAAMAQAQADIAARSSDAEAARAWDQRKIEIQNQFNQSLQDQRIAAGQYQTSADASAGAAATQHVIDQSLNAGSVEEALQALQAQQAELEAAGVNVAKAKQGIISAWTGE